MNDKLKRLALKMMDLFPSEIKTPQECYELFEPIYKSQNDYFSFFPGESIVKLVLYIYSYNTTKDFKLADKMLNNLAFISIFTTTGNYHDEECPACNGAAMERCETCYGHGEVNCEYCDGDGTEDFDLITWGENEILNGLTNVTLTYYNIQADADLGDPVNEIPTPTAYPSTGAETIWVRAVNLDDCVTVSSFDLIIDTVPDYTPVPLFQVCDDAVADGFTDFDLDSKNTEIATFGGVFNPDLTVTYHLTLPDAEAGTIPSLSSPYLNIVNPEFIWVRVEDDITGCYGAFEMELNVISPIAGTPTPLVVCDEVPNNGSADFDLLDPPVTAIRCR